LKIGYIAISAAGPATVDLVGQKKKRDDYIYCIPQGQRSSIYIAGRPNKSYYQVNL
jgi:hypothetical protein